MNRLLARARFRHIQVLVQLATLGSVRRTAEAVGMTQPGVTQLLADLERMLEAPLFHRHARGVRPTEACSDVLPFARQMLIGLGASAEAVAARRGLGEGVVRLVASTATVNGLLVRALPAFNEAFPGVQVQLKEAEIDDALLAIARGEVDMVGCREPAVVPQGWQFTALLPDTFVVACSADHPLVRRRSLGWADLAREAWLPAPAGSAARTEFDARTAPLPGELRICQVITRVPAATWSMLRHQRLLTLVPFSVVRHLVESGELAVLRLREPMPFKPLGVLLPVQDASVAAGKLAAFIEQFEAQARKKDKRK
ncbi:LysR family transcriptional regulator [Ramlibacter rhizophilus]|nr:LysR family transcriptional regulator [Ramlibacter rhizophilus]